MATFQPQIDKVSRVLGEIQIQQKYAQRDVKAGQQYQEAVDQEMKNGLSSTENRNFDKIDRVSNKSGGVEDEDPEVLTNMIQN